MLGVIDEIGWRERLADLIWTFIPASTPKTRTRNQINFRCPFCGDSKKSLTKKRGFYYIDTATYYCFNCEKTSTGLKLLKQMAPENVYADALNEYKMLKIHSLATAPELEEEEEQDSLITCDPIPAWKHLLTEPEKWEHPTALGLDEIKYLQERKAWPEGQNFLRVTNRQSGAPFIIIPWLYEGQCIFYQLHNYTKNEAHPKYLFPNAIDLNDQEKPVFNIDEVDPSWKYIIACEGVFDALSYKNGVALGGRSLTDYQEKMIRQRWPHHTIVAAMDNDDAGKQAMMKLCKSGSVKFLNITGVFKKFNVKDANDFARLTEKSGKALRDKSFLERFIKEPLEMQVGLLLG